MRARYTDANVEPTTATPMAPPVWRATSFMAEPIPAFASETAPITESVEGAMMLPIAYVVISTNPPKKM